MYMKEYLGIIVLIIVFVVVRRMRTENANKEENSTERNDSTTLGLNSKNSSNTRQPAENSPKRNKEK